MKRTITGYETITITDTFGGEANFAWVKRITMPLYAGDTDLSLVRRAKKLAGWAGLRCRSTSTGYGIELRPYGICQVLFTEPNC